jgi:hydrophobe/amphiphile efflux-1 (HAE1) family protein
MAAATGRAEVKFTHFFIDRPIFASVLCIFITLLGLLAYQSLPITQYPDIAPPTIQVRASYPGATAQVMADTVAAPLEQEINGVEGMLYMRSSATGDGSMSITITFALGTDLDAAQVLVQNRVASAEPRLPETVRRIGVVTQKNSPDLMMVVNLFSPDDSYDQLYIANYAVLQIRDELSRLNGVGQVLLFGASEYAMRVWLDPSLIQSLGLTAGDVVAALRAQNLQISAGVMNQPPSAGPSAFQIGVQTQGRLTDPQEFDDIVIATTDEGRVVRLKDVARSELGAQSYASKGFLNGQPAVALPIFQTPGTNAIETADEIKATMDRLAANFPPGLAYTIGYNPTSYIEASVNAVVTTILEAVLLVVLVIVLFLQRWRAALIPILAIPVSLIGTFAVMAAFGFSLNNLTLFGLVLAIGIVVDDAIVVVENVERNIAGGLSPRDAARATMDEVGGALIAMALVLAAVFIPAAFVSGTTGQFFRQFALTIATATLISALVSLTLSPALATLMLRPQGAGGESGPGKRAMARLFGAFNSGLGALTGRYAALVGSIVRRGGIVALLYLGLMALTGLQFNAVPGGFIPDQDQGYAIISIQLPPGSELERTESVLKDAVDRLGEIDGIANTVAFAGFSGATFSNAPNAAAVFAAFDDFDYRGAKNISFDRLLGEMREKLGTIDEAFVLVIAPPPVRGVGNAGGFELMIQDRRGRGVDVLASSAGDLAAAGNQAPGLSRVYTLFEANTPQLYLDIDRVRAQKLGVPLSNIFEALEIYFGSSFVNDFNFLGRTFRVTAQADAPYRQSPEDLLNLRTQNRFGESVPLGSLATTKLQTAPYRVSRYNLYQAVAVSGSSLPGTSSGEALKTMEALASQRLPDGLSYEWTGLAFQQQQAGNTGLITFGLAVLFVFLLLAAQYESWSLPLAIVLIVPMCLLSAMFGVWVTGGDNNILVQVGLLVLVGLAAKNAILIVEFARQSEDADHDRFAAAVKAAKLRLRPILMTSLAFILGVIPLVFASGPGAEMRSALGIAVFSGMLGVTAFGLLFTPVFYVLCRKLERKQG